ncbi:MAG: dienelactone hydrolase family protein, partial [Pirellulales bacterium]
MIFRIVLFLTLITTASSYRWGSTICAQSPKVLADTAPLSTQGDLTSDLVDGVDRFLLKQIAQLPGARKSHWQKPQGESTVDRIVRGMRDRLSVIDGLRDKRVAKPTFTFEVGPDGKTGRVDAEGWTAFATRWSVFDDVDATGLYIAPSDPSRIRFSAIIIPDAGQTPESLIGGGDPNSVSAAAAELAARGGEVIVPTVISRHREARRGRAIMTDQEFLYRAAFELGRHPLGYQLHEVFAAADALKSRDTLRPLLLFGWGEGGWVALHAAALRSDFAAVCVSGHFQAREQLWQEPIHRNQHGLLLEFGDAELAAMAAETKLIIDAVPGPQVTIAGDGGAPGELKGPESASVKSEWNRAQELASLWGRAANLQLVEPSAVSGRNAPSQQAMSETFRAAGLDLSETRTALPKDLSTLPSDAHRRTVTLAKWDRVNQRLLEHAEDERAEYWKGLDTTTSEKFVQTSEGYRKKFADEVIGRWELPLQSPEPRTRLVYDEPEWSGYETVLNVYDDVFAYGVLLLPKNQPAGEKRPCVVFQHGLEGRPQDVIVGDHPAYHDVAAQLAKRGFVVFAPQNLYIFKDRFRTLQRKSNLQGKTLFSTIVPQHQQIVNWLGKLPQVDPDRIAFYGLSYGGKSAMRIPPLVPNYCLSIWSADFNDWVWKNAS